MVAYKKWSKNYFVLLTDVECVAKAVRAADSDIRERFDTSLPVGPCGLHPVRDPGGPPVGHRHEPVREQQW